MEINNEILAGVLSKALSTTILRAAYQTEELHGGTLGNVRLVTGIAEASDGKRLPYKVVWKTQKKWERYGDPASWRREYDLYRSDLHTAFTSSFRWPECYHAEMNDAENEIQLWMEYIEGVSGLRMTGDMYERAAMELGRFQGRLYAEQPSFLRDLGNLSKLDYAKHFYLHYRSWPVVYDYIRSEDCKIPKHLCDMLISIDENADEVFRRIEKLPIVLCHRDFWVANIFCSEGKILLIDWDTTGWGYLGEDIASLIADEADVEHMAEHCRRCIPAYYRGFSEHVNLSHVTDHCIYDLILVLFGYRLVEWYLNADAGDERRDANDEKALHLQTLQKIYEMRKGDSDR